MQTDFWIFVLNPWLADGSPSLRGAMHVLGIMSSVERSIVETTPGTRMEAFPKAVPGFNTLLVRMRPEAPEAWMIPPAWDTDLFPWCVFSAQERPSKLTLVGRFNFPEEHWQAFVSWLDDNKRWLWQPRW